MRHSLGNSIDMAYTSNRSTQKQPMSNNFVNRSLQNGLPTQADTMSQPGAYHPQQMPYGQTIGTQGVGMGEGTINT